MPKQTNTEATVFCPWYSLRETQDFQELRPVEEKYIPKTSVHLHQFQAPPTVILLSSALSVSLTYEEPKSCKEP